MSEIITFYSYKGGVGRSMALANVAVLLSQWGYKTLMIDWDLEAPGLENFFKDYIDIQQISKKKGLIDILTADPQNPDLWKDLLITINVPDGKEPLHFITVGERNNDYFNRVMNFDVSDFYEKKDGGNFIEAMRNQWKEAYDFVLVDSRTGITDNGGICTIQLPDVLALIFTATEMGFNGILDVARRALKAQQSLPFERFKLISLPIPARFDTVSEFKLSQEWLDKFSKQLKEIYNDWLPTSVDSRKFIELTKIPHHPYFSFGEKLPVIEHGTNDPGGIGYTYETISALIANHFESIEYLVENREEFVNMAVKGEFLKEKMERIQKNAVKIFISHSHKDRILKDKLMSHLSLLQRKGTATFWSDEKLVAGMNFVKVIAQELESSQVVLLLISDNYLASKFAEPEMLMAFQLAEKKDRLVIPIILDSSNWHSVPLLTTRQVLPKNGQPLSEQVNQDEAFAEIAMEIEKAVLYIKHKDK
ncbi:MAG: TIR domain-containing protein [Candidatus Aminicenantes bacterium]|nr:TIR domain-containing protein [Candidatus Aminicenantes bacterium]